jgi:peroxiredoxin
MKRSILFILLCSFSLVLAQNEDDQNKMVFQNFILENLDGDFIELEEEIGEGPVLLSFWATWCKPCKEELKEYNKLFRKYSDSGLKIFAISIDNEKSIAKVKPYARTNDFQFTVLLDPNSEAARMYYAQMVPYSVILNKSGEIIYSHLGYKKGDELEIDRIISKLVSKQEF